MGVISGCFALHDSVVEEISPFFFLTKLRNKITKVKNKFSQT